MSAHHGCHRNNLVPSLRQPGGFVPRGVIAQIFGLHNKVLIHL